MKKICLEHNHQHDLAPALLEMCKKSDKLDLDERIIDVRHRAMEELTRLRRALDFRHSSLDPLEEWFLEKSINEQDFIVKSWDLIPDDQVRADLLEKSQQVLIRRERYPILPPLPRTISSNSRPVPPKASPSTPVRTSQAPTPEPERKVKRVAPPTPEATVSLVTSLPPAILEQTSTGMRVTFRFKGLILLSVICPLQPARKNARQAIVRSPSVEMLATPHAARSRAHVETSPIQQARQGSPRRAQPQAVTPVAVIDLCDSSDEDVKPDLSAPARLPRPTPPVDGLANASLARLERQDPAPLSPATPAAPTRSSKLADFLSSLEPDRHLERYLAVFGRSNLEIDDPRKLLSVARGPPEELDELVAELGKEVDGVKGMPTFWQRIFRRLLVAAADSGGRRVAEI